MAETFCFSCDSDAVRIDKFLVDNLDDVSRSAIQKIIDESGVTVNSKIVSKNYKCKSGDEIVITVPDAKPLEAKAENIPLDIVYEDNYLLVVNKPKGMVVHPANGNPDGTLVNALLYNCKGNLSGINGVIRPGIVHRIDKDTSGLLVVAKTDKAHTGLAEQIKEHSFTRAYETVVYGNIKDDEFTVNQPIGSDQKDRKKMAVRKEGKKAVTHFKVLQRFNGYTYLDIKIDTGRTHQIRVHLSEIGYPIVGDTVYSNGKNTFGVEGQMLHAKSLDFKHPITKEQMHLEAPLPEYFKNVLKTLENKENI